jgi:hypothetical protein
LRRGTGCPLPDTGYIRRSALAGCRVTRREAILQRCPRACNGGIQQGMRTLWQNGLSRVLGRDDPGRILRVLAAGLEHLAPGARRLSRPLLLWRGRGPAGFRSHAAGKSPADAGPQRAQTAQGRDSETEGACLRSWLSQEAPARSVALPRRCRRRPSRGRGPAVIAEHPERDMVDHLPARLRPNSVLKLAQAGLARSMRCGRQ